MKGRSNGAGSSLVYGTAIAIAISVAILFGCLALTAQAGRSPPHQLLISKVGHTTRAVHLASNTTTASAYHTEDNCFEEAADDDDERKTKLITLIFCIPKCYCHSNSKEDVCYCCQTPPTQVCYNTQDDCHANCPVCDPKCPNGTTAEGQQQQLPLHGTKNATL